MEIPQRESLLRNMRALVDSPLPPTPLRASMHDTSDVAMSPMSGLAQHLGATCSLQNPPSPRRRLSLSSVVTGTPSPLHLRNRLLHDLNCSGVGSDLSMTESPTVFKQVTRISGFGSPPRPRSTDKENSPTKPLSPLFSPSRLTNKSSPLRRRHTAPDENAENSQDSGVGSDPAMFRFAAPFGMAPRSRNSPRKPVGSPQHEMSVSPAASPVRPSLSLFHTLSSGSESVDDGFLDFLSVEKDDEAANLPRGLGSLLCGEIMRGRASPMRSASSTSTSNSGRKSSAKRSLHRSLSMADTTPVSSRARSCLFRSPSVDDVSLELAAELRGAFKRPDPPTPCHDVPPTKRRREQSDSLESAQSITLVLPSPKPLQQRSLSADQGRPRMALTQSSLLNYGFQRQASPKSATAQLLQRSFSESEASIKKALQRSLTEPDLIGDFSRPFALPLTPGRHPDLKTIAPSTLAQLLRGEFDEDVASYAVIDCRYPYEYSGGHIRGSRNVYSKDQVSEVLIRGTGVVPPRPPRTPGSQQQRHVLVFHCEFSSERAPSMSRHLRQLDRDANKECYPQLHYPEVYLLHGGYKAFYETHPELCDPCGYVPMLSQGNEADLKHFRAKSRSWADPRASAARLPPKHSLKRLEV